MFIGTQKQNMEDSAAKARISRGEHRPMAKLTEQESKLTLLQDMESSK
jgi:hypothetical protein